MVTSLMPGTALFTSQGWSNCSRWSKHCLRTLLLKSEAAIVYTQRTTYFQEIGKGPELRPLLEERVRLVQAHGVRASLSSGTYVMDGPTLSISLQFDDLA